MALALRISWWTLFVRTIRDAIDDRCFSLAAQMAFYLFLALFPAVLFLLALASFFPLQNLTDEIARALGPFVSPGVLELIQEQMRRLGEAESGGILTFGVLGALWSSSTATVSIVFSVNTAYDVDERRSWWKIRLLAIGLTLSLALFILTSIGLVLAGPSVATYLGRVVGFGSVFEWTWKVVQWPVAFALVVIALGIVYYSAPNLRQRWPRVLPGAIFATVVWMLVSLAFRFYVVNFASYNETYGAVGTMIVLMLWFYLTALAVLLGAEMNGEIRRATAPTPDRPSRISPGASTASSN